MVSSVPQPDLTTDDDGEADIESSRAPLIEHLIELRQRLLVVVAALAVSFVLCFLVSAPLYNLLTLPYVRALREAGQGAAVLNYFPLELFFAQVRLSFFAALMISFPVTAWQMYAFVSPGLYRSERRAVLPFLVAIPFLFAAGIMLVHQLILPLVLDFALGLESRAETTATASYNLFVKVGDYLNLALALMLGFGFAFQLPVVLTLLARAGIITDRWLVENRRYAIVLIFLVAAFLTPPDPLSQVALGLTVLALYEISIWAVRWTGRKRRAAADSPR